MITIQHVTIKNFMSVGNNTQAIVLNDTPLTLILGENIDQGASGSRNGVGKTTLVHAVSFALYGIPLTNVKKDNLINSTNGKNMVVTLDYKVDNKQYRIERGRKPNFLRFYVNDEIVTDKDSDEAHGESKITQAEIEKSFGMSHALLKHIVALHTKTTPFLSESSSKQRELIEELISITQLSEKAETLKNMIKEIKREIDDEDVRIKTMIKSNERVQSAINELNFKLKVWDTEHNKKIDSIASALVELEAIDIEQEIANHQIAKDYDALLSELAVLEKEQRRHSQSLRMQRDAKVRIETQLKAAHEHSCPTCGQSLHDESHAKIVEQLTNEVEEINNAIREEEAALESITTGVNELQAALEALGPRPTLAYKNIEQAYEHRHSMDKLASELERESRIENPYIEQIANLSMSGLQEISYDYINELTKMKEHQDFLYKMLTSKDSFIRKKIIDQNLSYLNFRLGHYLTKLGLPHEVEFKSDLSVEITHLGRDFDFEQLSNGEANRLILALAWAFRDVWESMNHKMNLMFIDELVDSGMDSSGTDAALDVLKDMTRTGNKNIFLISHKDGLETRVDRVAIVQKENNFTSYVSFTEDA